eukprot:gene3233-2382_t
MTKTVNIKVGMTCSGCSGAVTRILSKIEGVNSVSTDLETKMVGVVCNDEVAESTLVDALKKWAGSSGKIVELVTP